MSVTPGHTVLESSSGASADDFSRIIVKLQNDVGNLNYVQGGPTAGSFLSKLQPPWDAICHPFHDVQINRLFTSLPETEITALIARATVMQPALSVDLLSYYCIGIPTRIHPHDLLKVLLKQESVQHAYIQGRTELPSSRPAVHLPAMQQSYLHPAPAGIDAMYAWKVKGGTGKGKVKFVDIEQGWDLSNSSITAGVLPLTGQIIEAYSEHGTAVLSVILMKGNEKSSGITPDANGYVISQWRPDGTPNEADAILAAIAYLKYGDILLLETQSFYQDTGSKLWPVEIQEACFDVIRLATALGIIVIEAAGNGDVCNGAGNDLDFCEVNQKRIFDPFSKDFRDSGAIMVAACGCGVPHGRIPCSNFGQRINCFAWGNGIETIEYCCAMGKQPPHTRVRRLNDTSGAAAIIAGAAIAVQSIAAANCQKRLGPVQMRAVMSSNEYGTPSANSSRHDKTGVMPDLKKIIKRYLNIC